MLLLNKWFCFYNELDYFFKNIRQLQYAVVKGDILSLQAYGSLGLRNYSDIDILINRTEIDFIEKKLIEFGFFSNQKDRHDRIFHIANSHQVSPWECNVEPWGRITLDLNFDIFWGEYEGKRVDVKEFLLDTVEVDLFGVKVKALPPIKALIQLILHHYKDMNSIFLLSTRKSIKYDMFKDIYHLLKNNLDSISIDKLYTMSEEYDIIPYVFYVLYYTGQVFEDEILKLYIEAFRTPEGESLLNCYGLCAKERKEWKCDFNTRLQAGNLFELIKNDLTANDQEKITINKKYFMGSSK